MPTLGFLDSGWKSFSATQLGCRNGEGRSNERVLISSIVKDQLSLPPPDAKPEFHNTRACIMQIDPDQVPFFYNADAATGKKVRPIPSVPQMLCCVILTCGYMGSWDTSPPATLSSICCCSGPAALLWRPPGRRN